MNPDISLQPSPTSFGIFGFAGVPTGQIPPPRQTPQTNYGAQVRISIKGITNPISSRSAPRSYHYEPLHQEVTTFAQGWKPNQLTSSTGYHRNHFDADLFQYPTVWRDEAPTCEDAAPAEASFKKGAAISLDAVKLARRHFNAQATKDFEYKNQVLNRITDNFTRTKLAGLGPSTFRQYHSCVVQLTEHGYEPTLNGLGRFLADRASQDDARFFAHASLGTWRSAIVHFGVGLGYYFPTEVDKIEFRKLKSGLKSMNAEGITRVKGAISLAN